MQWVRRVTNKKVYSTESNWKMIAIVSNIIFRKFFSITFFLVLIQNSTNSSIQHELVGMLPYHVHHTFQTVLNFMGCIYFSPIYKTQDGANHRFSFCLFDILVNV